MEKTDSFIYLFADSSFAFPHKYKIDNQFQKMRTPEKPILLII